MTARKQNRPGRSPGLSVRTPTSLDADAFLGAVRRSRKLHRPWVYPPATREAYQMWIARMVWPRAVSFLVVDDYSREIGAVINLNEIVLGGFRSTYMGYYAFEPYAGTGLMTAGMKLVLSRAFRKLKLHRVEANIQPENAASIALVRGLGFSMEGISPRYLKIGGRWRDHERWALLADEWRPGR
jgi:ribosomal-protein-alanine N-acetyltransferase